VSHPHQRNTRGDRLDVPTERPFAVALDAAGVRGEVRVDTGGLLVDGDDVVHDLELAAFAAAPAEPVCRVGIGEGLFVQSVDVEHRDRASGDVLQDLGLGADAE
jgi:hypothetical protein